MRQKPIAPHVCRPGPAGVILAFVLPAMILISLFFVQEKSAISAVAAADIPPLTEGLFLRGEALYRKQCASCHGAEGKGDGKAAYLLYPRPRDFTSGEFRLVSTIDAGPTEEDLFKAITRGMPGSAMPSWEHLAENDRWALVYYACYLTEVGQKMKRKKFRERVQNEGLSWEEKKQMIEEPLPPEVLIQVPEEPLSTPESVARGRELFITSCAGCHGKEGKGDGGQEMFNTDGTPTRPRDLTSGLFKGYPDSEDLYYRLMAGLPGSPMPSYTYSLTEQETWDIIHFIQTLSNPEVEERARPRKHTLIAKKTSGEIPVDPLDSRWKDVTAEWVSLTPLWWRDRRIEGVDVKAVHNGGGIAIHLRWKDETQNDSTAAVQNFSDGAAVQFSKDREPPFFAMGQAGAPVAIWHWKASWQGEVNDWKDVHTQYPNLAVDWYPPDHRYDWKGGPFEASESETADQKKLYQTGWEAGNTLSDPGRGRAAEEAQAEGFGSLTPQSLQIEKVDARGTWEDGYWNLVLHRNLSAGEPAGLSFTPGETAAVAFAIWDGEHRDRNGQKMVSIWNEIRLEV